MINRIAIRSSLALLLALAASASGVRAGSATGAALVELFTSEGCSSCPPADALLERLDADARRDGRPLIALSFHVTYWDQQGWRDPFSDAAFTRRQSEYANRFALQSLYTPQMVVDGRDEFVGSNAAAADRALRDAFARPRATHIALAASASGRTVIATCKVSGAPGQAVLWVAWADSERTSSPDRGENGGRRLHHVHVVRALARVALTAGAYEDTVRLTRPEAVPGSIVAWVQLGDAGDVLAATSAAASSASVR